MVFVGLIYDGVYLFTPGDTLLLALLLLVIPGETYLLFVIPGEVFLFGYRLAPGYYLVFVAGDYRVFTPGDYRFTPGDYLLLIPGDYLVFVFELFLLWTPYL